MSNTAFEPAGIMGQQIFGLPVDRKTLFSNHKKVYKKRIEKRQRKLIIKLAFLKPFLKRGEQILLISTGYSPLASLAQYVTGFVFVYLKRSLFIFTNHRILHVPTTPSYQYKGAVSQIAYNGCKSIVLKGGTLVVEYGNFGKVETFRGIPVAERKKIRALMQKVSTAGTKGDSAERKYLCPRCTHRLDAGAYVCQNCQLKFKSKLLARMVSIIFPGGGYFYTRHYMIGFLNAILELYLLFYIGYIGLSFSDELNGSRDSILLLVALGAIFLIQKIIAVIHSNHFIDEFIPRDKKLQPSSPRKKKKPE
jgi:hypothetical protein